jgi:hypothetical protein
MWRNNQVSKNAISNRPGQILRVGYPDDQATTTRRLVSTAVDTSLTLDALHAIV